MKYTKFKREYFQAINTIDLSKSLLGKLLIRESKQGLTVGRIVETEAYLFNDNASHTYIGKTQRNKSAFEEAGTSYVYFIYGNYFCFNIVSNAKEIGEAILVRALEPIEGEALMRERVMSFNSRRRSIEKLEVPKTKLCNGPGKLCIALDINKSLDGLKLWNAPLYISDDDYKVQSEDIVVTQRVGITKAAEKPYRFYLKDSHFISKK